jgi:hypothetical protein
MEEDSQGVGACDVKVWEVGRDTYQSDGVLINHLEHHGRDGRTAIKFTFCIHTNGMGRVCGSERRREGMKALWN